MRQVTHSAESQQPGTDRLPSSIRRVCLFGPVPCKDMGNSLLLRSGHLDIKDTQCAETKDVLKKSYNITSRFQVMGVEKGRYERQFLFSEVAKFAETIWIDLIMIFCTNRFSCATLSF